MTRKTYACRADGWVAGHRVLKGELVELTEAEAKYEPVEAVVIGVDMATGADMTVLVPVLPAPSEPGGKIDMPAKPARRRKGAK